MLCAVCAGKRQSGKEKVVLAGRVHRGYLLGGASVLENAINADSWYLLFGCWFSPKLRGKNCWVRSRVPSTDHRRAWPSSTLLTMGKSSCYLLIYYYSQTPATIFKSRKGEKAKECGCLRNRCSDILIGEWCLVWGAISASGYGISRR